jgi:hypothetical protein
MLSTSIDSRLRKLPIHLDLDGRSRFQTPKAIQPPCFRLRPVASSGHPFISNRHLLLLRGLVRVEAAGVVRARMPALCLKIGADVSTARKLCEIAQVETRNSGEGVLYVSKALGLYRDFGAGYPTGMLVRDRWRCDVDRRMPEEDRDISGAHRDEMSSLIWSNLWWDCHQGM